VKGGAKQSTGRMLKAALVPATGPTDCEVVTGGT
jgi:hypothetical protein